MILLYTLAILVALLPLCPEKVCPFLIKWPVVFVVIFVITALFNLRKKDTIYITQSCPDRLTKKGLYHLLNTYGATSSFFIGFVFIETALVRYGLSDVIMDFTKIFSSGNSARMIELILGLVFIMVGLIFFISKWSFSKHADEIDLKPRAIYYVAFTVYICFIYSLLAFSTNYLEEGYDLINFLLMDTNVYVFYGIPVLFLIIDLIITITRTRYENKVLLIKEAQLAGDDSVVVVDKKFAKENKKQQKRINKEIKKQSKEKKVEETVTEEPVVEEPVSEEPVVEVQVETPTEEVKEETPEPQKLSKKELKKQAKEAKKKNK